MYFAPHFRRFFLLALLAVALLPARPAAARGCCAAHDPDSVAAVAAAPVRRLSLATVPDAPWMYMHFGSARRVRTHSGSRQFDYMFEPHLWLMGSYLTVPTGLPLIAITGSTDRNSFSQAGVGVGYMLTHSLRAITNWKTGLGQSSVSPGSQFTVGVALRY